LAKITYCDKIEVIGEWRFKYYDKSLKLVNDTGWLKNFITGAGLQKVAECVETLPSPYIVLGTDTATGETITEFIRKPVVSTVRTGNIIRFRAIFLANEGNTDFEKASLFYDATATAGTGTMFNLLLKPFSKDSNTIMTVEVKVTITQ
jgi:hypothetical protein